MFWQSKTYHNHYQRPIFSTQIAPLKITADEVFLFLTTSNLQSSRAYSLFNSGSGLLVLVLVVAALSRILVQWFQISKLQCALASLSLHFLICAQQFELSAPEDHGACSQAWSRETVHIFTERYVLQNKYESKQE